MHFFVKKDKKHKSDSFITVNEFLVYFVFVLLILIGLIALLSIEYPPPSKKDAIRFVVVKKMVTNDVIISHDNVLMVVKNHEWKLGDTLILIKE